MTFDPHPVSVLRKMHFIPFQTINKNRDIKIFGIGEVWIIVQQNI